MIRRQIGNLPGNLLCLSYIDRRQYFNVFVVSATARRFLVVVEYRNGLCFILHQVRSVFRAPAQVLFNAVGLMFHLEG